MINESMRLIIQLYCRRIPFHKGKTRLITWAFHHITPPPGFVRTHLGNGLQIEIEPAEWVQNEIYYVGYYEVYLAQLLRMLIRPGMVFADVGAHVGQYSLIAAERGAVVHAFEPNPDNFACLQRNIALNNLSLITLNQVAVSNQTGNSFFELPDASNTGTGALTNQSAALSKIVQVKTISLDEYFSSQENSPDIIKLDIEGAELMALQGAKQILGAHHPQ